MNGVRLDSELGRLEAWSGLARPNVFSKVMFRAMMDDDVDIELLKSGRAKKIPKVCYSPAVGWLIFFLCRQS